MRSTCCSSWLIWFEEEIARRSLPLYLKKRSVLALPDEAYVTARLVVSLRSAEAPEVFSVAPLRELPSAIFLAKSSRRACSSGVPRAGN